MNRTIITIHHKSNLPRKIQIRINFTRSKSEGIKEDFLTYQKIKEKLQKNFDELVDGQNSFVNQL